MIVPGPSSASARTQEYPYAAHKPMLTSRTLWWDCLQVIIFFWYLQLGLVLTSSVLPNQAGGHNAV